MVRDKRLDIRLSLKERKAIELIANQEGINLSEAARLIIREGCISRGLIITRINSGLPDIQFCGEVEAEAKP